jgi:hypothetical protein
VEKTTAGRSAPFPLLLTLALPAHGYNELTFVSRSLPSLWVAENRDTHTVNLP